MTIVYVQAGVKVAKLYAPAVALGTLSIASIVASHNILKKRNSTGSRLCQLWIRLSKEYRNQVVERFGGGLIKNFATTSKQRNLRETVTDPDSGKEKR